MARRTLPQIIPWPAPYNGVIRGTALAEQPPRSAINALNVRNRDPKDWRLRICRRAGLSKWIPEPVEAEGLAVQDIAFLNLNVNPPGEDLTIPGEPFTDDQLVDPPLPDPPVDPPFPPGTDEPEEPEPSEVETDEPEPTGTEIELTPSEAPDESSSGIGETDEDRVGCIEAYAKLMTLYIELDDGLGTSSSSSEDVGP